MEMEAGEVTANDVFKALIECLDEAHVPVRSLFRRRRLARAISSNGGP